MAKINIQEELRLLHTIPPVFNRNSKILILGSFPSVKSREAEFFYGHKQNRFWKVLADLLNESVPENTEEKKQLLLNNGIAVGCCGRKMYDENPKLKRKASKAIHTMESMLDTAHYMFR